MTNVRRDFQSGENIAFILHSYYDKSQEPAGLIDLKQLNNGASFRESHKIQKQIRYLRINLFIIYVLYLC